MKHAIQALALAALTLIPRPLYPVEIWQAVTSPPTCNRSFFSAETGIVCSAASWTAALAEPLKQAPGVLSVTAFGNSLHIAGENPQQMERALAGLRGRPGLTVRPADATLEDVFISLIGKATDNFAAPRKERT